MTQRRAKGKTQPHGMAFCVVISGLATHAAEGMLRRMDDPICPLCLCPIPADVRQSEHHLVPRLKGGAKGPRVLVHQICHNEVHATLSEAELARAFNTPEALCAHEKLGAFFRWVAKKPPGFYRRSVGGRRKR